MKKEEFNSRIKRFRKASGLTQQQLAKAVGVSHVTIFKWEEGSAVPKARYISKLADALRVEVTSLFDEDTNVEPGPDLRGKVPLVDWEKVGTFSELEVRENTIEYHAHTASVGPRSFALEVTSDSMTSQKGGKSITEGSIVIVDPDIDPVHGKVVVARMSNAKEATLKQLVFDGSKKYLKPWNERYPIQEINGNCTIIGVVKQVIQEF